MPQSIAIICITRNGINIARNIKSSMPDVKIYAQSKHSDSGSDIIWFEEAAAVLISDVFKKYEVLICIFSLGAVIRLISKLLVDKKYDPAVLVIDDQANYVISALSGHLGGANSMAILISKLLNCQAIITTAADVNKTIAVDLLGHEFGWLIDNFENVTKVSAHMVNEDKVGVFQDTGELTWWDKKELPKNVTLVKNIEELMSKEYKACLIITDRIINENTLMEKSVVYRPKSLVVGLGLHWDTTESEISNGIKKVLGENGLSMKSVRGIASIRKNVLPQGLEQFTSKHKIPMTLFERNTLNQIMVPTPSDIVKKFEGTASVAEAASICGSSGDLIVPKQKFPPKLTVAISRLKYDKQN